MPGFTAITAATSATASKTKPVSTPAGHAFLCCSPTGKEAVRLGFWEAGGFLTAVGFTCKFAVSIGLLMQRLYGCCSSVEGGQLRQFRTPRAFRALARRPCAPEKDAWPQPSFSNASCPAAARPLFTQRLPQLILSDTCASPEHSC